MRALSGLYGGVVGVRNSLFETGFFSTRRLAWPVVSVGNISVGGSGKTPFVILLGELLTQRGYWVDVLSRGYRRKSKGVLTVDASGDPERYGDEPLLIARKLHCPVLIGEDRYAAGQSAEQDYTGDPARSIHLLDDGFQHRHLHRAFDIVLLNREDLEDRLLPVGRLREPLRSLTRADAVVVDPDFPVETLPPGDFEIWRAVRRIEAPDIQGPAIAFCGIARPQRFFSDLKSAGIDLREQIAFPDHHRYSGRDIEKLREKQMRTPGSVLVTTEKDAVNLGKYLNMLRPIVIPVRTVLLGEDAAIAYMLNTVHNRCARS